MTEAQRIDGQDSPGWRFLGEWRIAELQKTDWWIGTWLKRHFPANTCRELDQLLPPPFRPERWDILGEFRPLPKAGRELVAAAKSAEIAELQVLNNKGPLRGKRQHLKRIVERRGQVGYGLASAKRNEAEAMAAIRYHLVLYWIIGPKTLPDRQPLSICSDLALNNYFDYLGLCPEVGYEEDTLRKLRARLALIPAAPHGRWVSAIQPSSNGRGLEPKYGGDVSGKLSPNRRRIEPLHPRTLHAQWGWGTALPRERLGPLSKRLLAAGWKKPDVGVYLKPGGKVTLRTVTNPGDPSRFWLFRRPA